jgi:seryl-tRNA synthetase
MPVQIEHDGQLKTFYTQAEVDSEVAGLKVTLSQLKEEKRELKEKVGEVEAAKLDAEESYATANNDKEALQRISDERDTKTRAELDVLKTSIRSEKTGNLLNDFVTKHGAGGSNNEDLRDLLKSRFSFDYDMDSHEYRVAGDNVASMADLEKVVKDSGRYDAYLSGTGSTGGDSQGSKGAGDASKTFGDYNGAELIAIKNSDPARYERLRSTRI